MRVAGTKLLQRLELLARPLGLAGRLELGREEVSQLDQHLDVEGGVLQPGLRQRPGRPVGRGVLLLHPVAEEGLDEGRQPDAGVAEQPAGQLGVEQRARGEAHLGEAGEVLGGGVQDPLGAGQGLLERGERVEADRVDQEGAGALAPELDQVGAGGVAVARGPLGVDRDRTGRRRERRAGLGQERRGLGEEGQSVAQLEQGSGRIGRGSWVRWIGRCGRGRGDVVVRVAGGSDVVWGHVLVTGAAASPAAGHGGHALGDRRQTGRGTQ